ncbi:uncharacterized protein LOC107640622 [Arachis ipaensis]|uniref:uncharacterized protein LOC107640622 n=1 Tax=Arachis ipaensis TaxID=130454 RepID=UPI0007AF7E09|nr:uncharacterized protein LOC107640622 [Arachis ipaensis]
MEQIDLSSDDEGEDTSELTVSSTKKGMSLDMYFKVHGINLEDEEHEEDEEDELDDAVNDGGNGGQASNEGTIKKKTRGKTMCKNLHATDFNDRREVEFFGGQPIGPTKEVVSNLNQPLGTTVKNPRFVTLLYTSWHGVPKNLKEDMWEYANQKFILPITSKPWVMNGFCHAWKKYKGKIKKENFLKYNIKKEMIKNQPLEIPGVQFRKLIRYWSLPTVKAVSTKNAENRSKQTCPHRMGSTNFGIVCKYLAELQTRIEAGENDEDAFVGVLGKDQPGRVCCYGASITRSSLKKDEEIRQVKVEYNNKVESLEKKMDGVCSLLKVLVHQVNPGMIQEDVAALVQATQNSPLDASSSRPRNTLRSSESTHIPPKDTPEGINGSHGISHFA